MHGGPVVDIARLRWLIQDRDVTCENCHSAMYEPTARDVFCPTCAHALGQDLLEVHAHIADVAIRRRA